MATLYSISYFNLSLLALVLTPHNQAPSTRFSNPLSRHPGPRPSFTKALLTRPLITDKSSNFFHFKTLYCIHTLLYINLCFKLAHCQRCNSRPPAPAVIRSKAWLGFRISYGIIGWDALLSCYARPFCSTHWSPTSTGRTTNDSTGGARYRVTVTVTETSVHESSPQDLPPSTPCDALSAVPVPRTYNAYAHVPMVLQQQPQASFQHTPSELLSAYRYSFYTIRSLLVIARIYRLEESIQLVLCTDLEVQVITLHLPHTRTPQYASLSPAPVPKPGTVDHQTVQPRYNDPYSLSLPATLDLGVGYSDTSSESMLRGDDIVQADEVEDDPDITLLDSAGMLSDLSLHLLECEAHHSAIPEDDTISASDVPIVSGPGDDVDEVGSDSGDGESYRDLEDTLLDILPLFFKWDSDHGSKFQLLCNAGEDSDELEPTCASTPAHVCIVPELVTTRHEYHAPVSDPELHGSNGRGVDCAPEQEQQAASHPPEPEPDSAIKDLRHDQHSVTDHDADGNGTSTILPPLPVCDSADDERLAEHYVSSAESDWSGGRGDRCALEEQQEALPHPLTAPEPEHDGSLPDLQSTSYDQHPVTDHDPERTSLHLPALPASDTSGDEWLAERRVSSAEESESSTPSADDGHSDSGLRWTHDEDVRRSAHHSAVIESVPFPSVSPPFSPTLRLRPRPRSNSFGWRGDDIAVAFASDEVHSGPESASASLGMAASSPDPILFLPRDSASSPSNTSKTPMRMASTSTFSSSSSGSTAEPGSRPTSVHLPLEPQAHKSRKWWQKIHPKKRVKKALAAIRGSRDDHANDPTVVNRAPGSNSELGLVHEDDHRMPGQASMQAARAKPGPRRVPSEALSFLSTASSSSGKSSASSTTVTAHVVPPGSLRAVDSRQLPWYV